MAGFLFQSGGFQAPSLRPGFHAPFTRIPREPHWGGVRVESAWLPSGEQGLCFLRFLVDKLLGTKQAALMNEKKVLMLAVNSSWSHSNPAFYYLRAMLRGLPYHATILEFTTKDHLSDVLQTAHSQQAQIVCLSAYIWNRMFLQQLLPALKQLLPEAVFVVGGPEAENLKTFLTAGDYLIIGQGEAKYKALAESGFSLSQEELVKVPELPLAELPFPYDASDLPALQGKLIYYELYRGCPYGCIYCLSARDRRKELRFDPNDPSDLNAMFAELSKLVALQPKTLKFVDRSFNLNKALAHRVWEFFIANPVPCEAHFEIYPDLLDEADLQLLERVKPATFRFEIGIQTIHPEVAMACGRSSNWQKAREMLIQLKQRTRVRLHTDLLVGLPGENYDAIIDSLNQLCVCLPDAVQLGILKILPDTPMLDVARDRGYKWLDHPPYTVLQTDALSYPELCRLEDYARLLNLYWNKEEHYESWKTLLQINSADVMLNELREMHIRLGYELHSLAKAKREAVMKELLVKHGG